MCVRSISLRLASPLGQHAYEHGCCEERRHPHRPLQDGFEQIVLGTPAFGYLFVDVPVHRPGEDHGYDKRYYGLYSLLGLVVRPYAHPP